MGAVVVVITLALARLTGRWGERAGILMFIVYLVPPTCCSSRCFASSYRWG